MRIIKMGILCYAIHPSSDEIAQVGLDWALGGGWCESEPKISPEDTGTRDDKALHLHPLYLLYLVGHVQFVTGVDFWAPTVLGCTWCNFRAQPTLVKRTALIQSHFKAHTGRFVAQH
ncbi:hypothetical protein K438DRAFT_1779805 [Mycena galopus ATCC 62051]|nr:hypothetical protein K438DRAFT_1779805 [Mycena galopus ATCC 62051]